MNDRLSSTRLEGGVVLLEVLVAVLIFSIGILAVIGLQAAAISSVSDAKYRVDASAIAEREIGRMWATQANLVAGLATIAVPELPSGQVATNVAGTAAAGWQVTITVTWRPPNATSDHRFDTVARIYGS